MKYKEFEYPNLDTYIEVLKNLLEQTENEINVLLEIPNKTYQNFLKPYYETFEELGSHGFYLNHINAVKNTDDTQRVLTESLPIRSEWGTKLGQREDIYQAMVEVSETDLNSSEQRVIDEILLGFKLKGIGMDTESKSRIGEINSRLSSLSNDFSKNVLDATKEFSMEVIDPNDVREFPMDELSRHVKEGTDHWEFTLQYPSYSAYMKYGSNSELRRQLYTAFVTRATNNEDVIEEILTLKNEKSKLLGYNNYAEISLLTKMVETPDDVISFLDRLSEQTLNIADSEDDELFEFVRNEYGVDHLNRWDYTYYVNKYKECVFDFKTEDVKPYFEQSSVLNGLFEFLDDKFNLVFNEVKDTYVWDDKVTVYDVTRNGEDHSRVYIDLESRDDKRGGAWMDNSETGYIKDSNGTKVLPIAYITCNFTPSTDELPSLLDHGEVTTLFHEMGHVLQHICSEVEDFTYAGINGIEWDAVEWSSQFLELFCFESDILKQFGKHYETGESITDDLITKLNTLRTYRAGNSIVRQVELGKLDMLLHTSDKTTKEDVQNIYNDIREELRQYGEIPEDKYQCAFSHIFAGGYSAGYYSYKWAEVLSVDAFLRFKELNDSDNYYEKFLSKGSSETSMEMFINYMGRKPSEENLVNYLVN